MLNRRQLIALSAALPLARPGHAATVNDDGLHTQPWFIETFLDLAEDRAEAAGAGKRFAIFFEQRGCPYCKEMHEVNLAIPEIVEYIQQHFAVLQLNLWGAREVTDFDGEALEERALARKWGINFTPTIVFLTDAPAREGQSGKDLEAARMPGYFKPFHFISMFEYVAGNRTDISFQRFLQEKLERLEKEGKKPDVWGSG